jgi:hypothetical protein
MRRGTGFGTYAIALAGALGLAPLASAEEPPATAPPATETRPSVGLDRLLKLPASVDTGIERRGGMTRGEWRGRFQRIEVSLASEESSLAAAQKERDRVAGSSDQWLLGAPGMTNTDAPLDFRLRQEITRHKEEIERLKSARDSLEVEANLAGVPEDWRKTPQ